MRKVLFGVLLAVSSSVMAADWIYAAESSDGSSFYIDKSYYRFNAKNQTVDIWTKTESKNPFNKESYISSKTLSRYSCADKKRKSLAYVEYEVSGKTKASFSDPETNFSVIFPDTIAEGLWEIACSTKGKGLKLKEYEPRFLSPEEMRKILPNLPISDD